VSRIADFIKSLFEMKNPRIATIVTSPGADHAVIYVKAKREEESRQVASSIAELAVKHGLHASVVLSRDVRGKRKSMVIVRELT
jgi:hypothetical protein